MSVTCCHCGVSVPLPGAQCDCRAHDVESGAGIGRISVSLDWELQRAGSGHLRYEGNDGRWDLTWRAPPFSAEMPEVFGACCGRDLDLAPALTHVLLALCPADWNSALQDVKEAWGFSVAEDVARLVGVVGASVNQPRATVSNREQP